MATIEQMMRLRKAISSSPEKKQSYLDYAKSKGFTDQELDYALTARQNTPMPGSIGEAISKSAVGQELQSAGEGFVQGMSAGIVDPRDAKPTTVDLPFFGETSLSRVGGNVAGAMVSPVVRGASAAGQIIAGRLAPQAISNAAIRVVAGSVGSGITGGALEAARELVSGEAIDPKNIFEVAAMDAALGAMPDVAPEVYSQLKAWMSKISTSARNLIERFKELPEIGARAEDILNGLKQEHEMIGTGYRPVSGSGTGASDMLPGVTPGAKVNIGTGNTENIADELKKQRAIQNFPESPPFPEMPSVTPGAGVEIGTIPTAAAKVINPTPPLLPTDAMAGASSALRESPEVIAAARTRAELQSPSRQLPPPSSPQIPFMNAMQGAEQRAAQMAELEGFKVAAEQKTIQAQRRGAAKAIAKRPSESSMSSMQERPPDLPERVQPARRPVEEGEALIAPPGPINLSNVLVGDITRKNAPAILEHAKELEKAAKKKIAEKAAKAKSKAKKK